MAAFDLDLPAAQRVADRLHPPARVEAVQPVRDGRSSSVFGLMTDQGALVLKTYPDQPPWWPAKEAYVSALIGRRLFTPIPRRRLLDESREVLPQRYLVMDRLPGAPLIALQGRPEATGLYWRMGALLRQLHALRQPFFGHIEAGGLSAAHASNTDWMAAMFTQTLRNFTTQGGDGGLVRRIEGFLRARADEMAACPSPVLCHNDFHPGNVLAAAGEAGDWDLTGLIDFTNAVSADPLFDLAKALDYTGHDDPAGREPLAQGYGDVDRPGALEAYRLFHKLELMNWFAATGIEPDARRLLLAGVREILDAPRPSPP